MMTMIGVKSFFALRLAAATAALGLALLTGACATADMSGVYEAYGRQDYQSAYDQARQLTAGPARADAAYMAGLSAYRLGHTAAAVRYLTEASRADGGRLAGDSLATLGLVYSEAGQYDRAAASLVAAAEHLAGEDRAKAWFYAAVAYGKLGRRHDALRYFARAETATRDAGLRQRIDQERLSTGWTIQIGAFSDADHARAAADRVAPQAQALGLGAPRIVSAQRGQQTLLLVQVGGFHSYDAAVAARDKLGVAGAMVAPVAPPR